MMHSWKKQKIYVREKKKEYLWALSFITSKWIIKKRKPPFTPLLTFPTSHPADVLKQRHFINIMRRMKKTCSDFYLLYLLIQNKPLYDLIL